MSPCDHPESQKTEQGCALCIGGLAAHLVMLKWRNVLVSMSRKERADCAPELVRMLQSEVVKTTHEMMVAPVV